jgi:DNA gyrase subunit A
MEIVELFKSNMLEYAGAVNQSRAIPDARTGLKPIHRKILYEMYADKIKSSGKYKKCAYMVGQIIARFSEHGDAATYDALVRLSQPWIQRYPLLDFHGNSGSQFGDSQAAMRYTESKLSELAEQGFLSNLDKKNVDWIPNFTNEEDEPATLPAVFPGLFCLPNQGIGYACASNFLTMNLSEVCDGLIQFIGGKDFPVLQYDLASGGTIINPNIMEKIYSTGKGSIIIDSNYTINNKTIIFNEIPFNVMFDDIMEEIISRCEKEELSGISDVRNNSGNGKIALEIDVARGYNVEDILNQLLSKTKLRATYNVNQVALVDGTPKLLTQNDMANIYMKHNIDCIKREFEYELSNTKIRVEILLGLVKALENIDEVIDIIKTSKNSSAAKLSLVEKFSFTENQTKNILDMKLSRLTKLDSDEIKHELAEKQLYLKYCEEVISSEAKQKEILVTRILELKNKFGDDRRTQVIQKEIKKEKKSGGKASPVAEPVVITHSSLGYLQCIPIAQYRNSNIPSFKTTTADNFLVFTNAGRFFRPSVSLLKKCGPKDKGVAIGSIIKLEQNEKVLSVLPNEMNEKRPYILFAMANGQVKKSEKGLYLGNTQNKKGQKAIKTDSKIIGIQESNGDDCILKTSDGYCLRFDVEKVRPSGKASGGVKGIALHENASVVKCQVVAKNEHTEVQTQGRGGFGKRFQ